MTGYLIGVAAFFAGMLVREFLGYLREKGKNLATKEDNTETTDKIESVSAEELDG